MTIDISNKTRVVTRTSGAKQLLPPGILNVHCQVAKIHASVPVYFFHSWSDTLGRA